MKLKELLEQSDFTCLCEGKDMDLEIHGAYCGDLLSWVMGNGQPGQAWITVQAHLNVIAVAVLREFSCIILADNVPLQEDALEKAKEEGITILQSSYPVFETAKELIRLGL